MWQELWKGFSCSVCMFLFSWSSMLTVTKGKPIEGVWHGRSLEAIEDLAPGSTENSPARKENSNRWIANWIHWMSVIYTSCIQVLQDLRGTQLLPRRIGRTEASPWCLYSAGTINICIRLASQERLFRRSWNRQTVPPIHELRIHSSSAPTRSKSEQPTHNHWPIGFNNLLSKLAVLSAFGSQKRL